MSGSTAPSAGCSVLAALQEAVDVDQPGIDRVEARAAERQPAEHPEHQAPEPPFRPCSLDRNVDFGGIRHVTLNHQPFTLRSHLSRSPLTKC
jgi:hypothetical protein